MRTLTVQRSFIMVPVAKTNIEDKPDQLVDMNTDDDSSGSIGGRLEQGPSNVMTGRSL
jgi:hypothetical protein